MKHKFLTRLIILFYCGLFTSCGFLDEDDKYFNGTMQARVNDELILFDQAYGERILTWDWEWTDIQFIVGETDMNKSGAEIKISFSFVPITGTTFHPSCTYITWTGNYNDNNLNAYYTKRMPETSQGTQFSSSIVLTSVTNNRYEGTFSFTAYDNEQYPTDSVVVTNGKFEIDSNGKKW